MKGEKKDSRETVPRRLVLREEFKCTSILLESRSDPGPRLENEKI